MPRAQLLIEGFAPEELLELAKTTSLLPLFAGKPVCVTYGTATLMGGVRKKGTTLTVEVGVMERGAEKAIPMLERLVKQIAKVRGVKKIEWRMPPTPTGSRGRA